MNEVVRLFIKLVILMILLEMSFIGLYFSKSPWYLIPIVIVTTGIGIVVYGLYLLHTLNKPKLHKEYSFYYISNQTSYEDNLYTKLRKRL